MASKSERPNTVRELMKGRKPKKFDGMEERQFSKKPWPPGKPPGGKLPPGPTAQDKSASSPDKPAE